MAQQNHAKFVFDTVDRQLIGVLRRDGRAPLFKLAKILNVSRGTVRNRLDRLLASGAVMGFTIRVREDYETGDLRAIMLIEVVGKSTSDVIRRMRGISEVAALHTTNGGWDLIAEIRVRTLSDFDRVLREIRMIEGVLNSETSLVLSSVIGWARDRCEAMGFMAIVAAARSSPSAACRVA